MRVLFQFLIHIFSLYLDFDIYFPGLSPILKRDGKDLTASIKAYLPGHVSVYSFEKGKKPALVSQSKFHDFAENPAHFNKKELQLYGGFCFLKLLIYGHMVIIN